MSEEAPNNTIRLPTIRPPTEFNMIMQRFLKLGYTMADVAFIASRTYVPDPENFNDDTPYGKEVKKYITEGYPLTKAYKLAGKKFEKMEHEQNSSDDD